MMITKKSVSPLISVILIIVVSVILVTIILSVTKNQAIQSLSTTDSFGKYTSSDIQYFIYITDFDFDHQYIEFRFSPTAQITENPVVTNYSVVGVDESNLFYNLPKIRSIAPYTIKEGINRLSLPGINLYNFSANDFKIQLYTANEEYIILSPRLTSKTDFVNRSDVILYYDYSLFNNGDPQITDLSDFGNNGTPTIITESDFGIEFTAENSQISVPADPSLNFGNTDFAIEFFIDENYAGHILSQRKATTSIAQSIYVSDNGILNFSFNNSNFENMPWGGLTTDEEHIYYASNNCITKITKQYSLVAKTCDLGGSIEYPTAMGVSHSLAVDDDYLYVSNNSHNRIIKLNKNDLSYVAHIGGPTAGDGDYLFNFPVGLFISGDFIYVADKTNKKIKIYNKDLVFIDEIISSDYVVEENFDAPYSLSVDDDFIFVSTYKSGTNKINKYNKNTPYDFIDSYDLTEIAISSKNVVGPIYGLDIDSDFIYFTGVDDGAIYKYTKDFDFVQRQGFWGYSIYNQFYPYEVKVDGDYLYVSDRVGSRIVKRKKSDLSYINHFGYLGKNPETFVPRKVTADDEHIYLADCGNNRVLKISQNDFSIVDSIGGPNQGTCDDCFTNPCAGITVYDSNLYVLDMMNQRIVIKDKTDLSHIYDFNSYVFEGSTYFFNFDYDIELAVDSDYIYLANRGDHKLLKINKNTLSVDYALTEISGFGSITPKGVTVDDQYLFISSGSSLLKLNKSDLTLVNSVNTGTSIFSLSNDSEYVYLGNRTGGTAGLVKRKKTDLSVVLTSSKGIMNRVPKTFNNIGDITGMTYGNGFVYSVSWYDGAFYRYSADDFKFRDFRGSVELMQIRSNHPITEKTHVVVTRNNNRFCVYLNGVEENCKTVDYDLNISFNNYPLLIGNMETGDLIFNRDKKIYYLRFYKKGLTEPQINALYLLEKENRFG